MEKLKEELKYSKKGITLIALIVTIVVLLILAGVSIATLTGDNGLLTKAQQAKEENEKAADRDLIAMAVSEAQIGENGYQELNQNNLQEAIDNQFNGRDIVISDNGDGTFTVSCLDALEDYKVTSNGIEDGIDWNEILANAQKHPEQKTSTAIGVGTDGKPVNMDLWEYTLLEDGTYALNDELTLSSDIGDDRTPGYLGTISIDGEIEGTIPQYISIDNGENYIAVTSLQQTFRKIAELKKVPKIPSTVKSINSTFLLCTGIEEVNSIPNSVVDMQSTFSTCTSLIKVSNLPVNLTNMQSTFNNCSNLSQIPEIPSTVINMMGTFAGCTSLEVAPTIPNGVINMQNTFNGCISLKIAPTIPNSVTNMAGTFGGCTGLTTATTIPSSVTNLKRTFQNCNNLSGILEINASITGKLIDEEPDYYACLHNVALNGQGLQLTGMCSMLQELVDSKLNSNSNVSIIY